MDTSKEYIEMCKEAQGVQDRRKFTPYYSKEFEWNFQDGDYYVYLPEMEVNIHYLTDDHYMPDPRPENNDKRFVWLPGQDQLQEIMQAGLELFYYGLECDAGFGPGLFTEINKEAEYWYRFTSFEQCWLALVMKKKYNQVWNFEAKTWEMDKLQEV